MQELTKDMNESTLKAIGEFMKPEQIARLKQISYQAQGAMAFTNPDVVAEAEPHGSPEGRYQDDRDESMEQMRELRSQFQDDREAAMKKMAEIARKRSPRSPPS